MDFEDLDKINIQIGLSIAIIIYIFGFIFLFLGKLFLLHFWLCVQNLTFYEHIKEKWINYPYKNPFDKYYFIKINFNLFILENLVGEIFFG